MPAISIAGFFFYTRNEIACRLFFSVLLLCGKKKAHQLRCAWKLKIK
jgi:hypothetical protein